MMIDACRGVGAKSSSMRLIGRASSPNRTPAMSSRRLPPMRASRHASPFAHSTLTFSAFPAPTAGKHASYFRCRCASPVTAHVATAHRQQNTCVFLPRGRQIFSRLGAFHAGAEDTGGYISIPRADYFSLGYIQDATTQTGVFYA